MSTSTMMRVVKWGVRDWATCFSACAFPSLDEETGADHSTKLSAEAMIFDPLRKSRRESNRRNSRRKKYEQEEKEIVECPKENAVSIEAEEDESNDKRWPSFADEEYIVFCFREDGAIHMIKERKPSEASDNQTELPSRNLMHVNQKGNEKEDSDVEIIWPPDEIKEVNHIEATNDNIGESAESVDSKRSDSSSTGSFAFPVLGWEWMGSPVQMPKPHLRRNHRARAILLHCCRF